MSEQQREAVRSIIKPCIEQLEALNYGMLALAIERRAERYLDQHYPLEVSDE